MSQHTKQYDDEQVLSRFRDFIWFHVEERHIIVIDLPEETTTISFKVSRSLANKFEKWCRERGTTKSEVLRRIVEEIVNSNSDNIVIELNSLKRNAIYTTSR